MRTAITVYFGAAFVAMFLVPIICRLAKRFSLVDAPGLRKVHQVPIPRIGGIAFVVATFALVLPIFFLDNSISRAFHELRMEFTVLLSAGFLVFMVGFIDDLYSVRAWIKFLSLIVASLAVCASGATVHTISIGPWFEFELGWLAWPLAVGWITTITVGMNFIDGLDGLAGGIAAIVCGTVTLLAFWNDQVVMSILMLALLGSLTGFLFFNSYPAKIFMGDGGAMFLGFMIGAGSLVCQAKTCTLVGLAFPFLVLGIPILDTSFTMIRRGVLDRRSIFAAERGHLHHRLLDSGLCQRTVVIIIYSMTALSASIGMFMLTANDMWSLVLLVFGLVFLLAVFTILGAARIRDTITALQNMQKRSRERKDEKGYFEDSQLRMRETKSFNCWWESLCTMAEQMQFQNIEFNLCDRNHLPIKYERSLRKKDEGVQLVDFTLPLYGNGSNLTPELKVEIIRNGSLEGICRQVGFLARLMDEFPPPLSELKIDISEPPIGD